MRDALPEVLREIADLTDVATALAVAEARGGVITTIVARLNEANWLVQAVGMDKAKIISHHFTSGKARVKLFIPFGPQSGSYNAEKRRRSILLAKATEEGLSAAGASRLAGVTDRSVYRFRARAGARKNSDQGSLF